MNRLTWAQALEVCQAASPPYRFIFKLQLHCGWGIGELFQFNSAKNWENVRAWHQADPSAPYYRIDFPGRKSNNQPFYSLIPHKVIQEILDSGVKTPFVTFDGKYPGRVLDAENYHNSEVCLNSAFKRALKRTKIKVEGRLSPHDFRDCFRTECTLRNLPYEVGEFALGHTVDQRGYVQCYRDVPWLWNQISLLFGGPSEAQEVKTMREEIKELREQAEQSRLAIRMLQDASGFKVEVKT
jgi:integrase